MDLDLKQRSALVTGSSSGIGASVARALAREGCSVFIHGRNSERAQSIVADIERAGGQARVVIGDLTIENEANGVFDACTADSRRLDILVHNAGGYAVVPWLSTTVDSWRNFYEQDVLTAVRLNLRFAPLMKEHGWGRIIHIGTGLSTTPGDVMADYAAAKASLTNSTVSLAKALAGSGVTVNTVSPGLIETDAIKKLLSEHATQANWGDDWDNNQRRWFAEMLNAKNVSRLGLPSEVADLVTFLSSERAGYINGANLRIDGGLTPSMN